jgi:ABC-2 type transport system ATP-binding protein
VADDVAMLSEGTLLDVRSMEELRSSVVRRVELVFGDDVPATLIRQVPGVRDVQVRDLTADVELVGPAAALLRAVASYDLRDIQTHETDLADVFLGYYTKGEPLAHRLSQGALGSAPDSARLG